MSETGASPEPTPQPTVREIPEFTVHDRLRKAREVAELDQLDLARVIGISRQTVGNYEGAATKRLKSYVVKQWALVTGLPYEWLMDGTIPAPTDPDGASVMQEESSACNHRAEVIDLFAKRVA